jgi:glycosyltransferase involved in cell wall biosynthesis
VCWQAGGPQRASEAVYFDRLQRQAERLGIGDRVVFMGPRGDIASVMNAADIYCQPNAAAESFGLTFIEALDAGLPVVATNIGGAAEIVDGTCGVLVPPGSPGALALALGKLLADRDARARLGAGGPRRARALCDPAARLDELVRVLAKLVYGGAGVRVAPGGAVSR